MRLSLSVTNYSWPDGPAGLAAQLGRVVRAADEAGLDTVWVADVAALGIDHVVVITPGPWTEDTVATLAP